MLQDALKVLAATTPPPPTPRIDTSIGKANARIAELEKLLGVDHGKPTFNPFRAARRIAHLEGLLAQVNAGTLAPTAAAPIAVATVQAAAVAPAIATAVQAIATAPDTGMLTATLAEFRKMDAATRLQFAQDNGALSHADFSALSAQAKMNHCRNGGRVLAEHTGHIAISTAARSFGRS